MSWSAVLMAVLAAAPGNSDTLRVVNMRATYGVGGPDRPDNKVLPGDTLVISYDIEGMRPAADGKFHYRIGMEVSDRQRAVHLKQDPKARTVDPPAGASGLPGMATLHVGLDQPAGEYTVKLTVTDDAQHASAEASQTYEVLPRGFGLVHVTADGDPASKGIDLLFHKGKPGVVNFTVVGFGRRQSSGQPDVKITMNVLGNGRHVLERPTTGDVKAGVPAKALAVPMELRLELASPGRYTIQLMAEDHVTGQNCTVSVPITVSR